jgi:hypothetical protein
MSAVLTRTIRTGRVDLWSPDSKKQCAESSANVATTILPVRSGSDVRTLRSPTNHNIVTPEGLDNHATASGTCSPIRVCSDCNDQQDHERSSQRWPFNVMALVSSADDRDTICQRHSR